VNQLPQHLVNALILGGTYALLGIGLSLIFGIMRVVNFTHGEMYAFGAYVTYALVARAGMNFFAALPIAILAALVLGGLLERTLLRPLRDADIDTTMLVMIGAWIIMQNAEMMIWGGEAKSIATPFSETPLTVGSISVSALPLFSLVVALLLIAGTYGVINYTRLGTTMRATFQDRETATLMGVQVDAISTLTFAMGSSLAGAAGALLGPVFLVTPTMGDLASLKAFAVVILGGLGNITGATIGGFALAAVEEMGAGYLSSAYRDAMGFLVIIAVLAFRPTGLFARAERVG
jgi:branched-chain amino acid transport system permease protein